MKIFPDSKLGKIRAMILIVVPLIYFLIPLFFYCRYSPQEGDIIFQSLPRFSDLVKAIEGSTNSPFSHCGVVVKKTDGWYVAQALGNVHSTPLFQFILQGRYGKFVVYRLKSEYRKFVPSFVKSLAEYAGRPYDFKYSLDDENIYCSELAYKAYKLVTGDELGQLVRLGDLNWVPYKEVIMDCEQGPPPLDRLMITPRDLAKAKQLELVYSYGYWSH